MDNQTNIDVSSKEKAQNIIVAGLDTVSITARILWSNYEMFLIG